MNRGADSAQQGAVLPVVPRQLDRTDPAVLLGQIRRDPPAGIRTPVVDQDQLIRRRHPAEHRFEFGHEIGQHPSAVIDGHDNRHGRATVSDTR